MTTILETPLDELVKKSFLDYSMSVITSRALPDVRDGLKPVHRRILYGMHDMGMHYNTKYKKSARIVGDVMGKYHPHGDSAIYDAAVRMAQPFSLAAPLIDGQGNFGNIDGDSAAAMRYTEMRLTRLAGEFFDDIGKETVAFEPNYDGSETEPTVLPVSLPHLLVNGIEGIAVGMACSMPPHNLSAVVDATKLLMDNPEATTAEIVGALKAPDFPTGGLVHDLDGLADAVERGRGRVRLRSRWHEEDTSRGPALVITELPYATNKKDLIESIVRMHEAAVENNRRNDRPKQELFIRKIQDESSKEGLRIWISLRPEVTAERTFHELMSKGIGVECGIHYNCTVLVDGKPMTIGLRRIMLEWLKFRRQVVLARFVYDRKQALARLHILAGLMAALAMLDAVIRTIREAKTPADAKSSLMSLLSIDDIQAQAILDMRLQKLTGLEIESIREEHAKVTARVAELTEIIESPARIDGVIRDELDAIAKRYGVERRTEIAVGLSEVTREDLIVREDVLIAMTRSGYVKRMPVDTLERQNRGTRGKKAMEIGGDDAISFMRQVHSHDSLLVFASSGQAYGIKAYRIPELAPSQKARHIKNVIEGLEEEVTAVLALPEQDPELTVLTVTRAGQVKRTSIDQYENATRRGGIAGVGLDEGDSLVAAFAVRDADHLVMVSSSGNAIRFSLDEVRPMGRAAGGVRGMKLEAGESIIGATVVPGGAPQGQFLLCAGDKGVGKRTPIEEFPVQGRAGMGVIAFRENTKTGKLVTAMGVTSAQDLIMFASNGVSNRIAVSEIRETGRAAAGVILINLDDGQTLVSATTALRTDEAAAADGAAPSAADAV